MTGLLMYNLRENGYLYKKDNKM